MSKSFCKNYTSISNWHKINNNEHVMKALFFVCCCCITCKAKPKHFNNWMMMLPHCTSLVMGEEIKARSKQWSQINEVKTDFIPSFQIHYILSLNLSLSLSLSSLSQELSSLLFNWEEVCFSSKHQQIMFVLSDA